MAAYQKQQQEVGCRKRALEEGGSREDARQALRMRFNV